MCKCVFSVLLVFMCACMCVLWCVDYWVYKQTVYPFLLLFLLPVHFLHWSTHNYILELTPFFPKLCSLASLPLLRIILSRFCKSLFFCIFLYYFCHSLKWLKKQGRKFNLIKKGRRNVLFALVCLCTCEQYAPKRNTPQHTPPAIRLPSLRLLSPSAFSTLLIFLPFLPLLMPHFYHPLLSLSLSLSFINCH